VRHAEVCQVRIASLVQDDVFCDCR
jgi:hypothetical protein